MEDHSDLKKFQLRSRPFTPPSSHSHLDVRLRLPCLLAHKKSRLTQRVKPTANMLHADKLAFEANLAQDLVAIQMKELDYLYKNLANLATSSAVLVGFGFSGVWSW